MSDPTSSTDPLQPDPYRPSAELSGGEGASVPPSPPTPPAAGPTPADTPGAAYPPGVTTPAGYPQGGYPQGAYQQAAYPQGAHQQGASYPTGAPLQPYPKNDLAVWSLVLGLAGFVLGCMLFTGIPAVILGRNAQRAAAAGEANNPGLATAGIVLGWVSIALTVVAVVLFGVLLALGIAIPLIATETSSVG